MSTQNQRHQTLRFRHSQDESDTSLICRYCFQPLHTKEDLFHFLLRPSILCGQCRKQLVPYQKKIRLESLSIYVMYEYTTFLEGMIFQFKEGRDIALGDVFFFDAKTYVERHYRNYTIVLLPSSKEKMLERSFLPVQEMLRCISLPKISPFYKTTNYKQSLQHLSTRKNIKDVIKRNEAIVLPKTPLLFVDDVCTSGNTLLAAYHLLKDHPYPIEAFVLAAHPELLRQYESK